MSQLLETLKIRNGKAQNLVEHQRRINHSFSILAWDLKPFNLSAFLKMVNLPKKGIWKCRVIYHQSIQKVQITPYEINEITSLKIVHADNINYNLKWEKRTALKKLYQKRAQCDDIIIVKNGMLTDSYYANLIFLKNKKWYTPKQALLKGTQRAKLLKTNKIIEKEIRLENISTYEKVRLINAMLTIKDGKAIDISKIYF